MNQMLPDPEGEPAERDDSREGSSPAAGSPHPEESQWANDQKRYGPASNEGDKAAAEMIEEVNRHPQLEDHA